MDSGQYNTALQRPVAGLAPQENNQPILHTNSKIHKALEPFLRSTHYFSKQSYSTFNIITTEYARLK